MESKVGCVTALSEIDRAFSAFLAISLTVAVISSVAAAAELDLLIPSGRPMRGYYL